jgi:hypothetical protein
MNAGNTRRNEQLCEAAFARGGAERNAVQQNLSARSTEQNAASSAFIKRAA